MKGSCTKFLRFVISSTFVLCSEVVILLSSSWLLLKKFSSGISMSGIFSEIFLPEKSEFIVALIINVWSIFLFLAIVIKVFSIIFQKFPLARHNAVEPMEICTCLELMNREINDHITSCDNGRISKLTNLRNLHRFDINIALVLGSLAHHVCKTMNLQNQEDDVFVSFYIYEHKKETLYYSAHYHPRKDEVSSKIISLSDSKYSSYEMVKCMKSSLSTSYLMNKKEYSKGGGKRYDSLYHYMGSKLELGGKTVGFINIEFHNHAVFTIESEMREFIERYIFPFKLLLEYQFLKKEFFDRFKTFEECIEKA